MHIKGGTHVVLVASAPVVPMNCKSWSHKTIEVSVILATTISPRRPQARVAFATTASGVIRDAFPLSERSSRGKEKQRNE